MQIDIILATYNSAAMLERLLVSLLAQDEPNFRLIVGDDGSSDETLAILERYSSRFVQPMQIIAHDPPMRSAIGNFAKTLTHADADYVFLCDHDDIWHPDKVSRAVRAIGEMEAQQGLAHPILYHSDLRAVNATGQVIARSYWAFKSLNAATAKQLSSAILQPSVTGCTIAMNRALVSRLGALPTTDIIMHDWWINLVAATFGTVIADPVASIDYCIHGANVSRPKRFSVIGKIRQLGSLAAVRALMARRLMQAEKLFATYDADWPESLAQLRRDVETVSRGTAIQKRIALMRSGLLPPGVARAVAMWLAV